MRSTSVTVRAGKGVLPPESACSHAWTGQEVDRLREAMRSQAAVGSNSYEHEMQRMRVRVDGWGSTSVAWRHAC